MYKVVATEVQNAGGSRGFRKYARHPADFLGREQPTMRVPGMRSIECSHLRIDSGLYANPWESLQKPRSLRAARSR